jgi:L-alanine-DL-glutamate epimerase-like enolase superfamily enzyme
LGGLVQERLQAYASDVYWQENPSDMADEALRVVDCGFRAIKIHIGYGKPKEEFSRVQAVRKALGEGFPLMVDINAGYNLLEARQAVKLWESCDITWLEEPLNPNHVEAIADLRSKSAIPIASGENEFRIYGFKHLFEQRAVDVAMPDIGRAGGLMETKNICSLADTYGIPVSPHNFSSGVLLAATIHLMASTPNTQWLEMDTSGNAVYEELLTDPLQLKNGYVKVPSQPGLGVELTEATLEKYAVS